MSAPKIVYKIFGLHYFTLAHLQFFKTGNIDSAKHVLLLLVHFFIHFAEQKYIFVRINLCFNFHLYIRKYCMIYTANSKMLIMH